MRPARSVSHAFAGAAAVLCALALAFASVVAPTGAEALTVEKLTARPNTDSGSDVVGGEETRITLEVQADPEEALTGLALTFPEGTAYGTEDLRVTMLSGEDLMDREFIRPKLKEDGQTLKVSFPEAAPAGRYFRLEVYGVNFPVAGGDQAFGGSYTLDDGSDHEIKDIPTVKVRQTGLVEQIEGFLEGQAWVQAWNSNKFLRLFLNPLIIVSSLPVVFGGFLMALAIVLVAFPVAIPFGFCLALMRISKSRILRCLASIYVNIIRGTPAFLQIYIAFFGLPLAGVNIGNYQLGVIVMAMNSTAYLCEIFRAGIQSIPKGQSEAARSLGMNGFQTMLYVIVPQTFRNVIPTLTSEFILLYKDTSLLASVGILEVVMYAKTIVASTGSITPYIVAALFYLVVTLPLSWLVGRLEARLQGNDQGGRKAKRQLAAATVSAHESGM